MGSRIRSSDRDSAHLDAAAIAWRRSRNRQTADGRLVGWTPGLDTWRYETSCRANQALSAMKISVNTRRARRAPCRCPASFFSCHPRQRMAWASSTAEATDAFIRRT